MSALRPAFLAFLVLQTQLLAQDALFPNEVSLPVLDRKDLRILTPQWLEIRFVTQSKGWDVPENKPSDLPQASDFSVTVNGGPAEVVKTGFRRYPVFADYHEFDLRLMNQIFLQLETPAPEMARVQVTGGKWWPGELTVELSPVRESPLIHFNRLGYAPHFPKLAYVSYDLGSAGELVLPEGLTARVINADGKSVFENRLVRRSDNAWKWHQAVDVFDFSALTEPGIYRIEIPGLGVSAPLRIQDAAFAAAARLHALGMYHQRSGAEIGPPWTRFAHAASHMKPAEIPDAGPDFRATNKHIGDMARKNTDPTIQTAPRMDDVSKALYPFVRKGTIDVSGGHYDAGDYSKYVLNSAALIHVLTFSVDHFPGVDAIDNLGLPESGDGIPDALQIALWEADFLLKMQDDDGGFFFLVYPRNRAYELDVLPENGDPQVVFPKTTASTAVAVGALAQMAASPALKKAFPDRAKSFLAAARKGYAFLQTAIARHGLKGSYQAISHYGNYAGHTDELCYAAAALFSATGEKAFEDDLKSWWPDPTGPDSTRWGWWPLFESYGYAARTYAFCERNGILPAGTADPAYLAKMQTAIRNAGTAVLKLQEGNAFGIPLSFSGKRRAQIGWYWAMDQSFDLIGAWLLTDDAAQKDRLLGALVQAFGFECGANPSDRAFVSGAGPIWRRQVVNRMSLNDDRALAPPGISSGNVFSSPYNLKPYQIEGTAGLRRTFFPALDQFAFYDRAGTDAYNLRAECVTAISARILAGYLFLMAQTDEAQKSWVPSALKIEGLPASARAGAPFTATVQPPGGMTLQDALVVWEEPGRDPATGLEYRGVMPEKPGRLEVEVVWPDGRRLSAVQPLFPAP